MAYLTLKNINKIYPNGFHAVHDFNLEMQKGEFIVFVGPSGCGKSTTLRKIAGLEDISNGEFLIDGKRANEQGPRERGIAMVFQSYALYPQMTVYDNIAFGLELQGADEEYIDEKVRNTARILGLTDYLDRLPRALSGGQRQRVAIGRALIRKVGVFLMDEPLSNLDAKQRVTMRSEITQIHRETGATTIYVTHDQTEAMTIPGMIEKGHGKIINICSMTSELGRETVSAYAAAKGGLKMLTRNICSEYGGANIQCNGIGPGYIATPQTAPLRERQPDGSRHPFDQFIVAKTPAARWGTPEDLMGPAVFLASDASDFVNGHILYVDGGILAYIGKQP